MINTVNIVGAGNVANFLVHQFNGQVKIQNVYSRSVKHATTLAKTANSVAVNNLSLLSKNVDLTILCVSDDALSEIISQLDKNTAVVHTSGSVGIQEFQEFKQCGILYPLQTITKSRITKLQNIPFLIEANSQHFADSLMSFSKHYLSENTIYADSEKRAQIHLAAVFANNFTNFFLTKASEILEKAQVDFSILEPLMKETISKAFELGAAESQTGPAKRNDKRIIEAQLNQISNSDLKEIYLLISKLIGQKK